MTEQRTSNASKNIISFKQIIIILMNYLDDQLEVNQIFKSFWET